MEPFLLLLKSNHPWTYYILPMNKEITSFSDRLEKRIRNCGNAICFGIDPVLKRIPLTEGSSAERIERFYLDILNALDKEGVYPAAVKPNAAYFEALGLEAQASLKVIIEACQDREIPVVLDAKRGDIGKSSSAYADAAFDAFAADSVTVSPYMGSDSVKPFLDHPSARGVYALLRTSNPGGADLQNLDCGGVPLYLRVAEKLIEWDNGNLGAVVGATNPTEMEEITRFFVERNNEIPFLIPGVSVKGVSGQQGGDAASVLETLKRGGSTRNFHLLNSSSGLSYAYEAYPKETYAKASAIALASLIEDCGKI